MNIKLKVDKLEKLLFNFIESVNKKDEYKSFDISGCRQTDARQQNEITENSDGVFDIASLGDENSEGVLELAEYVAELEERITALEER